MAEDKNINCAKGVYATLCQALENRGFRAAAMECVAATYNRNKELGKQ